MWDEIERKSRRRPSPRGELTKDEAENHDVVCGRHKGQFLISITVALTELTQEESYSIPAQAGDGLDGVAEEGEDTLNDAVDELEAIG